MKNTETLLSKSLEVTTLGVLRSCKNSIVNYSQALLIQGGTGDCKRLGKGKNTNLKSYLRKSEVFYVSLQCTGQSEGYVKLPVSPPPHPFPFVCCLLVVFFFK